MFVDITKGYRQYSPTELREYAYKNLLVTGGFELGDFLEYIFTGYKPDTSDEELDMAKEDAYNRGYSDAKQDAIAAVENI